MYSPRCTHRLFLLLALTFFSHQFTQAQEGLPAFGQATQDELSMKECVFDRTADAVILLDHAEAYFDAEHKLITERRIRLKILKDKGIERGNVRIPYYSHNDFEYIRDLEATVISPSEGGAVTSSALERKNVFTRQANKLYSLISFALPNVKVGSIIDYKYRSVMKNYNGLKRWEFQSDIPVVRSSYELAPLANAEFAYSVYKSSDFPIQITPNKQAGKIKFVMTNIPGLRDEVYMTTTKSFIQRVNFQFASYTNYIGKTNYTSTWKQLSDELLDEKEFGGQAKKDLSDHAFIKSLAGTTSPLDKLKAVYDFVRNNITWDNIYSKYSLDGVKTTLEKKKGSTGDINLLLVSLLRGAGLTAYPVLVSERDYGNVDTTYSYRDQFNKVVAMAVVDNRQYVLDGTDMLTPFFLVPSDLLNTVGFIVDKKKNGFVYFNNLPHKQREVITINGFIEKDGAVNAMAVVSNMDYAKLGMEQRYRGEKARYLDALVKPHSFVKVDSFALDGLKNDSAALREELRFHYDLKQSGGYYLLHYNLFTGLNDNPFITQYRFTDIDFGTKYNLTLTGRFVLPEGMVTDNLPVNKKVVSPDRTMSVTRLMQKQDNAVDLRVVIDIEKEKYPAADYLLVKGFFKEVIDLLNEPVLLKAN